MSELTDFLLARITDDEAVARATSGQPWSATVPRMVHADGGFRIKSRYVASTDHDEDRAHIARWNPARVLAECEAKRRIVDAEVLRDVGPASHYVSPDVHAAIAGRTATPVLRLLALPYADHPEYRSEWAP
jgi:hypothetical protein